MTLWSSALRWVLSGVMLVILMSSSGCSSKQLKKFLFPWSAWGRMHRQSARAEVILCRHNISRLPGSSQM